MTSKTRELKALWGFIQHRGYSSIRFGYLVDCSRSILASSDMSIVAKIAGN